MKIIIHTNEAPPPVGPYSQAIKIGNFVFTAGQIPLDPQTGKLEENDIQKQTERVIKNIEAVLKAAGSDLSQVIKTTVFLKNMNDFAHMNEIYGKFFSDHPPARSAVEVSRLPRDVLVEIECIAVVGSKK